LASTLTPTLKCDAGNIAGAARVKQGENDDKPTPKKPYQFLHVPVLREYLQRELHPGNLMFEYNFERVIDDWVFICFFGMPLVLECVQLRLSDAHSFTIHIRWAEPVGNDFLPHLPSLKIREGAVDLLMQKYKTLLPSLGGYLTENGDVDLRRVEALLEELAQLEDGILRRRREREMRQRVRGRCKNPYSLSRMPLTSTALIESYALAVDRC